MEQVKVSLKDTADMSSSEVFELHRKHLNSGYVQMMDLMDYGMIYQKATGCMLEDKDGKEYLDFLGGYGSLNLGHNHPAVLQSLKDLEGRPNLVHNSLSPYPAVLAARLAEETGGELPRAFFCSSGSEAVEAALKLAQAATGRHKLVHCTDAYHGKSLGALSVAGREHYKAPFRPLFPGCIEIPFGDAQALEEVLRQEDAAAFIVEPIQGEGGVHLPPEGYLRLAKEICSRYGTLLILDEVQTGMGRTGKLFAYQHEDMVPDILVLAKSLGGGMMPIGAYLTTDPIHQRAYGGIMECLLHSATFGGNSLACAAAIATLETLHKEQLVEESLAKGNYLLSQLYRLQETHPVIKEVRGRGLLIGVEFHRSASADGSYGTDGIQQLVSGNNALSISVRLLKEFRILTGYSPGNPNLIRIEPPLIISYEQIKRFIDTLEHILEACDYE
jgi:putrescine aminotransferase